MKALLFPGDQQFWYETLRALGHTAYGGADIGEVVTTAARISACDYGTWYAQWTATAARTEAEARGQLAAGHQVSGRDGLLRAATYYRSAEFFTRDRDPDPRGRPAYEASVPLLRRRRRADVACGDAGHDPVRGHGPDRLPVPAAARRPAGHVHHARRL